jgi:hypothetical protein
VKKRTFVLFAKRFYNSDYGGGSGGTRDKLKKLQESRREQQEPSLQKLFRNSQSFAARQRQERLVWICESFKLSKTN